MMDTDNNYQEAKKRLSVLKAEKVELHNALRAAATAGDAGKIDRLRRRQAELPGEIFEAEFRLCSANVASLRAEQAEAQKELERAKAKSRMTDERVKTEVAALDAQRKRLTDEAYADLLSAHRIDKDIQRRAIELQAAEHELKKMLEQAVSTLV